MSGKIRVLVVDDEPAIAELVARMLTRAGYDADSCCSPLDALETIEETPDGWDIVVTDQSMPDMSGEEFAARLKTINPGLPAILCTGHDADRLRNPGSAISAVLVKPASREQLDETIKAVLRG
jgi:DNA-binding response OmpR family regulator